MWNAPHTAATLPLELIGVCLTPQWSDLKPLGIARNMLSPVTSLVVPERGFETKDLSLLGLVGPVPMPMYFITKFVLEI